MAATDKKKRRPGFPRKQKVPDRITLRVRRTLYDKMSARCRRMGITQRQFIEDAIRAELEKGPNLERPHLQKEQDVSRTGMWIEPKLLSAMDRQIEKEHSSQRAFIEDAVKAHLDSTKRVTKTPPTQGSKNGNSSESENEKTDGEKAGAGAG